MANPNTNPLISVVLPTYNGSRYLNDSIKSVVEQTWKNWELILVDDCSTDATPEIIAGWMKTDSRIRYVRNETNLKLPRSLNRGFEMAAGDFLTWTSDDNLYRPTALQAMVGFLRAHPATGLVYADFSDIGEQGEVIRDVYAAEPESLAEGNCVRACFMYPAEVRRRIGNYDENKFLVEDWDYWLRIAHEFPLGCLHQNLYLYRWHANSLTTTKKAQVDAAIRQLLEANLPQMKWAGPRARAGGYLKLAELADEAGDEDGARKYFKSAWSHAPIWSARHARRKAVEMLLGRTVSRRLASLRRGGKAADAGHKKTS